MKPALLKHPDNARIRVGQGEEIAIRCNAIHRVMLLHINRRNPVFPLLGNWL